MTPPCHLFARLPGLAMGLAVAALASAASANGPAHSPATDATDAGMLDVQQLAPDITVEARYAGADNFTGAPVPGYQANRCLLLAPVAQAVARVQARLRTQGLGLRIYDCYRPVQAVQAFVRWAGQADDPAQKARWYPRVDKPALVPDYIASSSGHSRGATLDVTLQRCQDTVCEVLEMGTPFDLFDPLAHTDAPGLAAPIRAHRQILVQAMAAEGLVNYPLEWWHFSYRPEPTPVQAFDFPVR
jgi:D-alanyl-D-alanine dipeptidase